MNLQARSAFAREITVKGLIINTVLCAAKFAAGVFGRSSAMVADAVHSLSDSLTDIVVLASLKFSARPADQDHAYGHGRFETMSTLVISVALFTVGAKILYNGILDIVRLAEGGMAEPLPAGVWSGDMVALLFAVCLFVLQSSTLSQTMENGWRRTAVLVGAWALGFAFIVVVQAFLLNYDQSKFPLWPVSLRPPLWLAGGIGFLAAALVLGVLARLRYTKLVVKL